MFFLKKKFISGNSDLEDYHVCWEREKVTFCSQNAAIFILFLAGLSLAEGKLIWEFLHETNYLGVLLKEISSDQIGLCTKNGKIINKSI